MDKVFLLWTLHRITTMVTRQEYYGDGTRRRPREGRYDSHGRSDEKRGGAPPPPPRYRTSTRRDHEPLFFRRLGLQNRRQELLLIVLVVGSVAAWFLTPLPDHIAGHILNSIPIEADVDLGREAMYSLADKYPEVSDRWGVERVGREIVSALNARGGYYDSAASPPPWRDTVDRHRWSFGVVRADFANAFALPGGIVRVTDSLLRQIKPTEGELAALLGHEMGHVLRRHSQRREVKQNLATTVLRALTYEDHDGYDETFGEAVGEIMLKGAAWLGEKGFSRRDEYEADEAAWDILVETETFDPRSVAAMLGKLWSLEGGSGKTRWESTHPGTADRIKALQEKWDGLDWREQGRLSKYPRG